MLGLTSLLLNILYLRTLQKTLEYVSRENWLMDPAYVWFGIFPLIDIVWSFVIAWWVPNSLQKEFREQGRDDGSDYGMTLAMSHAVLRLPFYGIISIMDNRLAYAFAVVMGVASFVLFVAFWIKIAGYGGQLAWIVDYSDGEVKRKLGQFDATNAGTKRRRRPTPTPDSFMEGDPE
jgi:hypothetical protein